jgi:DNA topoisomerase IB
VDIDGSKLRFELRGKSGKDHFVEIQDRRVARHVKQCRDLPGQTLFQYLDEAGERQKISSEDVNAWLKETTGEDFTAKDFRTWGGTMAAVQAFAATELPEPASQRALAKAQREVVCQVAARLGNTPAVCRKAYIDPCVFAGWERGELTALAGLRGPRQWEQATLKVLRRARRLSRKAGQPQ